MALQVLGWLGVIVLGLLILLIILPVRIVVSWQSDPARRATVLLRPFGGVFPAISVYDSTRKTTPDPPARPTRKRRGRGRRMRGNVVGEVTALLRRVLAAIHLDALMLDAEFGLGDPADTGQLFGQLCPLIHATGGHVQLRPRFDGACLHGTALAQFRVTPLALAWPFVGFGWRVFGPRR